MSLTCLGYFCFTGLPLDHNIKTAFLLISENVQHGDELKCSYPACAEQGVKFCWCSYCKAPVARRNFRVRHHHAYQAAGQGEGQPEVMETHQPMETANSVFSAAAYEQPSRQPQIPPASLLSQLQSLAAATGQTLPQPAQTRGNDIAALLLQQLLNNSNNVVSSQPALGSTNALSLPAAAPAHENTETDSKSNNSSTKKKKRVAVSEPVEAMDDEDDDVDIGRLAFQMKIPCPARGMPPGHHRLEVGIMMCVPFQYCHRFDFYLTLFCFFLLLLLLRMPILSFQRMPNTEMI